MTLRAFFGKLSVYLVLSIGATAMIFPFYWMLSTSFKSRQEAGSSTPVLLPERMQFDNWAAAYRLGTEGRPGLLGGLLGGFKPGQSVNFRVVVAETEPQAGLEAVIPRPLGVLSFPLGDQLMTSSRFIEFSEAGSVYGVTLEHQGEDSFSTVPLELRLPRSSEFVSSSLAPNGVRNTRNYRQISYSNIVPGTLRYIFSNYLNAWQAAPFGWYFFNSAFTATVQVMVGLIIASMAAFALARIPFWGREILFIGVIGTLMIPAEVLLIPNYVLLARLNWIDTYYALIVPFIASAFGIFLLRQFFLTLPQELFDAARIDGASWTVQLWRVAIPLALPGLLTYALFAFLGSWNALLWPLIVTNSDEMRTIQVGLTYFVDEAGTDYGKLMAASTLAILPIIVGFLFVQKQFIQGIARSGLK